MAEINMTARGPHVVAPPDPTYIGDINSLPTASIDRECPRKWPRCSHRTLSRPGQILEDVPSPTLFVCCCQRNVVVLKEAHDYHRPFSQSNRPGRL